MILINILHKIQRNWGRSTLLGILFWIAILNIRPGLVILGNDNFSPELNPTLTLERSFLSPAWRTYRVLGLPSDSEQADMFRTSFFWLIEKIIPKWLVSQGYLFFTFIIASYSMAALTTYLMKKLFSKFDEQIVFLLGGLFYTANILTSWIYFYPIHLFIAAYAFLPLVIWREGCFFKKPGLKNTTLLFLSALLLSTSALTATMFMTCSVVIVMFSIIFIYEQKNSFSKSKLINIIASAFLLIFSTQAYWFFPFITYIKTNTQALQDSPINREITATTIENETKHNTAADSIRYYASWMDTKEDTKTYTFPYREWYKNSTIATILSFIPIILALIGSVYIIFKKAKIFSLIPLTALLGWFLIKGSNPPIGFIYYAIQQHFPVFAQAFRWQSSKIWPFLTATIPILSTLGFLIIYSVCSKINHKLHRFLKSSGLLPASLLVITISSLLIFIYPYFNGDLIRPRVFLNVPSEYTKLASFLNQNDKFSRIYLSPESNTLYFRNYSWGFWGSVFLNYLLPNPLVEKALIPGSYENEQAYTVLTNAYYSENPATFTAALKRYDTPLILSDKNISEGNVGYKYNWNIHSIIVDNNPDFEKIWQSGNLTLYALKNYEQTPNTAVDSTSPQTNFTKLNTILASTQNTSLYYSQKNIPGKIFLFAQMYDKFQYNQNEIIAETAYAQLDETYRLNISNEALINSPVQMIANVDNHKVQFSPLLPYISVNNHPYYYRLPSKSFEYKNNSIASFVSIDDQVVDIRDVSKINSVSTRYKDITKDSNIKIWTAITKLAAPVSLKCSSYDGTNISLVKDKKTTCESNTLVVDNDSAIELESEMQSDASPRATFCIWSSYRADCLNRETSLYLNGNTRATTLLPYIFQKGDRVQLFLNFETENKNVTNVKLNKLIFNLYQTNETPQLSDTLEAPPYQVVDISLSTGDQIGLHAPILGGGSSFRIRSGNDFLPNIVTVPLESDTSKVESHITKDENGNLSITNGESNTSLTQQFIHLDPQGSLGMLFVAGENKSGIPIKISFADKEQQYKLNNYQLPYNSSDQSLNLFNIPNSTRSYTLEILSTGLGPKVTNNSIHELIFQTIPLSWYTMQLIPSSVGTKAKLLTQLLPTHNRETNTYTGDIQFPDQTIVSIPTAYSPNWRLSVFDKTHRTNDSLFAMYLNSLGSNDTKPQNVMINGWKQGWIVSKEGRGEVVFSPNYLVYIGYVLIAGIIIDIAVQFLANRLKKHPGPFPADSQIENETSQTI